MVEFQKYLHVEFRLILKVTESSSLSWRGATCPVSCVCQSLSKPHVFSEQAGLDELLCFYAMAKNKPWVTFFVLVLESCCCFSVFLTLRQNQEQGIEEV